MIKFNVFIYQSEEEYYEGETWSDPANTDFVGLTLSQAVNLFNANTTAYKVILVNQGKAITEPDRLYIDLSHGQIKNFVSNDAFNMSIFSSEIEQL